MNLDTWIEQLRSQPKLAVGDLLSGSANVTPYDRAAAHEFLLAILPRSCRRIQTKLLGEPNGPATQGSATQADDLLAQIDAGLSAWLLEHRQRALPNPRKLSAYASQVSEALKWPVYFDLPQSVDALKAERAQWLAWLDKLVISAYRDPCYDYWQLLATVQTDDSLQFHWQLFVVEAFRTRSPRYLDLGLLALAGMPLSEADSIRNLRLQVQALINRYLRRQGLGVLALTELAEQLVSVRSRNQSLSAGNYQAFLEPLLTRLGENKKVSVLAQLGLGKAAAEATLRQARSLYKLEPPGLASDVEGAIQDVRNSHNARQAWQAIRPILTSHEAYLRKSGDAYFFVRTLDRCARALCEKYELREAEIRDRLFQWIHLSLQADADNPRLWMLWELALRKARYTQRAQWVLWEMTRRFPEHLPCRVELARLLAESSDSTDQAHSKRLLEEVLRSDPENLHAYSTLAQLAIKAGNYPGAIALTQKALAIDPTNQPSAVLQTQAYDRRGEPGDLECAIENLQLFVNRNRGMLNAEGYLGTLINRKQSSLQQTQAELGGDVRSPSQATGAEAAETDAAWLAFSQSVSGMASTDLNSTEQIPSPAGATIPGLVLPLPQALKQSLQRDLWDANILDAYDDRLTQEFPLETRLWKYLAALHSPASGVAYVGTLRHGIDDWMQAQFQTVAEDDQARKSYFDAHWSALSAVPPESALIDGKAWLFALLDRQRPLPAPVLV